MPQLDLPFCPSFLLFFSQFCASICFFYWERIRGAPHPALEKLSFVSQLDSSCLCSNCDEKKKGWGDVLPKGVFPYLGSLNVIFKFQYFYPLFIFSANPEMESAHIRKWKAGESVRESKW